MKKIVPIIIVIAILVITGSYLFRPNSSSSNDDLSKGGLYPLVSISPDDQHIAFAYNQAIFIAKMDGADVKQLTFPKDDYNVGPEFSPDGTKILFISYPKKSDKPSRSIFIMDANGSNPKQVTEGKEYVSWATFSVDSKKIFFLSPDYYGQYSQMYRPGYHDVDVYSINIDGTDRKQLTDLKAYGMGDIGVSADGKELYFTQYHHKATFYSLSLDNGTQMKSLNSKELTGYYCLSPDKKYMVFHAVSEESRNRSPFEYELFVMDMGTKQVRQLTTLHGYAISPRFFHSQHKVIFLHALNWPKPNLKYELMSVDLDGTHLEKINLPFK